MFELKPRNKHAVIKTIDNPNKIGNLFTPGNLTNLYRAATIVALDNDCNEANGFKVGDVVLCDMIGVVCHRVGSQSFEMCLIRNFIAVVVETMEETA